MQVVIAQGYARIGGKLSFNFLPIMFQAFRSNK